jgi:hypothetical protein
MILTIYILSVIYCFYHLIKRYRKTDFTQDFGVDPNLDAIMVILLAPFLATIDITLTWVRIYKESTSKKERVDSIEKISNISEITSNESVY